MKKKIKALIEQDNISDYCIIITTLIAKKLRDPEFINEINKNGHINIVTGLNVDGTKWNTKLSMSTNDGTKLKPLELFDLVVHDALFKLLIEERNEFSAKVLFRYVVGDGFNSHYTPTSQQCKSVIDSVEKLSNINVEIDARDEFSGRHCEQIGLIKGNLVAVSSMGDENDIAYVQSDVPVLFQYCEANGQFSSIPYKIINTSGVVKNTRAAIVIKRYLLERIVAMKNTNNKIRTNVIKFDSIWNECNLSNGMTAKKKHDYREYVVKILDCFKEDLFIVDYTVTSMKSKGKKKAEKYYSIKLYFDIGSVQKDIKDELEREINLLEYEIKLKELSIADIDARFRKGKLKNAKAVRLIREAKLDINGLNQRLEIAQAKKMEIKKEEGENLFNIRDGEIVWN